MAHTQTTMSSDLPSRVGSGLCVLPQPSLEPTDTAGQSRPSGLRHSRGMLENLYPGTLIKSDMIGLELLHVLVIANALGRALKLGQDREQHLFSSECM